MTHPIASASKSQESNSLLDLLDGEPDAEVQAKPEAQAKNADALLLHNGVAIIFEDATKFISLNAIHSACGSPKHKTPSDWMRTDLGKRFTLSFTGGSVPVLNRHWRVVRGNGAGTWSSFVFAIEYSRYLDTQLAVDINTACHGWLSEDKYPVLKHDHAVDALLEKGIAKEWLYERLGGQMERSDYCKTIKRQAVDPNTYKIVTATMNRLILGTTAKKYLAKIKAKPNANLRDTIDADVLRQFRESEGYANRLSTGRGSTTKKQFIADMVEAIGLVKQIDAMSARRA